MKATIIAPTEYLGDLVDLCNSHRGTMEEMAHLTSTRISLRYKLPLSEIVVGQSASSRQGETVIACELLLISRLLLLFVLYCRFLRQGEDDLLRFCEFRLRGGSVRAGRHREAGSSSQRRAGRCSVRHLRSQQGGGSRSQVDREAEGEDRSTELRGGDSGGGGIEGHLTRKNSGPTQQDNG